MKEFIEKLIGRLNKEEQKEAADYNYNAATAFNSSIKIANQLAEEYNNGWIPNSERLPNSDECTLNHSEFWVTEKNGNTYKATFDRIKEDWFDSHDGNILNVIAWQPLSAPYQPKGE